MSENMGLCLGCMNKLGEDGKCTHCNYDPSSKRIKSYLAAGTVLDERYIVGKILSNNGEGVSYIGYDKVTNEKVVVREYFPDTLCRRAEDSDKLIVNQDCLAKYKTFMSEFAEVYKVLSRLRNLPHIVPAVDMFAQNNTTYAILEYVEGVSLRKFLQENTGTLSWEQVKKIFPPIFTTLGIIHNSGIVHRGICPDNIIVTINGELKLIGFSISSMRTVNTELNAELYSGYAAPEQYTSLAWQGTWTDVYAICAVLYRILTGTVPPEAQGRINSDRLIEPIRINPRIPVKVSKVIMEGLEIKGEKRIQSITDLVTKLFEQPKYVEHTKGATQTIPIDKAEVSRNHQKKNTDDDDKFKKTLPTILAATVVVVIMCLAVFLIYQIFFAEGADDSNNDSNKIPQASTKVTTSVTTLQTIATTTEPALTTPSGLGTGALMPDVVNQRYESVKAMLEDDFAVEIVYDYSSEITAGFIMAQSIAPDTEYSPENKNKLVVTVSYGPESVEVPEFSGMTQSQYISVLDELKIKYKIVNYETDSVSAGRVVAVDKEVGDSISIKEGEILTVSVAVKPVVTTLTEETQQPEPEETDDGSSEN